MQKQKKISQVDFSKTSFQLFKKNNHGPQTKRFENVDWGGNQIIDLKKQLNKVLEENSKLSCQNQRLEKKILQHEKEVFIIAEQKNSHESIRLFHHERTISEAYRKKNIELQNELNTKLEENKAIKNTLKYTKIVDLEISAKAYRQEIQKLQQLLIASTSSEPLNFSFFENNPLNNSITQQKDGVYYSQQIEQLQSEINKLNNNNNVLQNMLNESKSRPSIDPTPCNSIPDDSLSNILKRTKISLEECQKKLKNTIQEKTKVTIQFQQNISNKEKLLEEYKIKNQQLSEQLNKSHKEKQNQIDRLHKELQENNSICQQHQQNISNKEKLLEEYKIKNQQLSEQLNEHHNQQKELLKNFSQLDQVDNTMRQNIEQLENKITLSTHTIQEKQNQIDRLHKELQENNSICQQHQQNISNKEKLLEEYKIKNQQLSEQLNEHHNQQKEKQNQIDRLNKELQENNSICQQHQQNISNKEKLLEEYKIKNQQLSEQLNEHHNQQIEKQNQIDRNKEKLLEEYKIKNQQLSEQLNEHHNQQKEKQNQIDRLNKELQENNSICQQHQQNISNKEKLLEEYNTSMSNQSQEIKKIESQHSQEVEQLKKNISELIEKNLQEVKKHEIDTQDLLVQIQKLKTSLKTQKPKTNEKNLKLEYNDLKEKYNKKTGEFNSLLTKNQDLSKNISKKNDKIIQLEENINQLKNELLTRTTTLDDERIILYQNKIKTKETPSSEKNDSIDKKENKRNHEIKIITENNNNSKEKEIEKINTSNINNNGENDNISIGSPSYSTSILLTPASPTLSMISSASSDCDEMNPPPLNLSFNIPLDKIEASTLDEVLDYDDGINEEKIESPKKQHNFVAIAGVVSSIHKFKKKRISRIKHSSSSSQSNLSHISPRPLKITPPVSNDTSQPMTPSPLPFSKIIDLFPIFSFREYLRDTFSSHCYYVDLIDMIFLIRDSHLSYSMKISLSELFQYLHQHHNPLNFDSTYLPSTFSKNYDYEKSLSTILSNLQKYLLKGPYSSILSETSLSYFLSSDIKNQSSFSPLLIYILKNSSLSAQLYNFMTSIYCQENLDFLNAVTRLSSLSTSKPEFSDECRNISNIYIESGSLNISSEYRESFLSLDQNTLSIGSFDPIVKEVIDHIEDDILSQFFKTTYYFSCSDTKELSSSIISLHKGHIETFDQFINDYVNPLLNEFHNVTPLPSHIYEFFSLFLKLSTFHQDFLSSLSSTSPLLSVVLSSFSSLHFYYTIISQYSSLLEFFHSSYQNSSLFSFFKTKNINSKNDIFHYLIIILRYYQSLVKSFTQILTLYSSDPNPSLSNLSKLLTHFLTSLSPHTLFNDWIGIMTVFQISLHIIECPFTLPIQSRYFIQSYPVKIPHQSFFKHSNSSRFLFLFNDMILLLKSKTLWKYKEHYIIDNNFNFQFPEKENNGKHYNIMIENAMDKVSIHFESKDDIEDFTLNIKKLLQYKDSDQLSRRLTPSFETLRETFK